MAEIRSIFRRKSGAGLLARPLREFGGIETDARLTASTAFFRGRTMITTEQVEAVLSRVRPFIQADGGDIQLVRLDGNAAEVRMTGRCAGCPSAHMTLYVGVEGALRRALPEFGEIRVV
jgi:Fe-S cluster biogenesis protein NfuA